MTILAYVKRLFSLDTLDTRFSVSSRSHPSITTNELLLSDPSQSSPNHVSHELRSQRRETVQSNDGSSTSKWKSPEFKVYAVVFLLVVPLMFKSVYDVSNPSHPNYSKYEHLLSEGWILGRKVDNSDQQYAGFRNNIPYLLLLLVFHPLLRRGYEYLRAFPRETNTAATGSKFNVSNSSGAQGTGLEARKEQRITFDLYFASVYIFALHGSSILKILVILCANYAIAKRLKREHLPVATWVFNIGILFANELCKGYSYAVFAGLFTLNPNNPGKADGQSSNTNWGSYLDSYGGLIPRWEVLFNITVLRLISFNLDFYWSSSTTNSSPLEKKQLDPASLSERDRIDIPAEAQDYSFRHYLAYALYAPLYLTGPILTFNDYISQVRYMPISVSTARTTYYGVRFLISLLAMEFMLHFLYAVAISKAQPAWELYSPFQLSMIGYFNLHIIWLKLLLPWRFFRLWALIDGIDPPENMVRCMSDNYSTLAFWRGWHRSYNRWTIRYIYIPLGGSGGPSTQGQWGTIRAIANMLTVFTFVALWHDIQLRLLVWGWLVTLFVLPEVLGSFFFPKKKWQNNKELYRVICGIGAVGNILMMMAANLIGFAVGLDGLKGLVQGIVGSYTGLIYLLAACATLFVGVQVMFEIREEELRHGIKMKC